MSLDDKFIYTLGTRIIYSFVSSTYLDLILFFRDNLLAQVTRVGASMTKGMNELQAKYPNIFANFR